MPEKQVPLPLSGDEVRNALLHKIGESLLRDCHLSSSNAYSGFSGEITIRLTLSDLGREVPDNHAVTVTGGDVSGETEVVTATIEVSPDPVNKVRVDTEQPVPIKTQEDGKTVIKNVKYQANRSKK